MVALTLALLISSLMSIGGIVMLITFWLDTKPPNRPRKWFIRVCKFLTFLILGVVVLHAAPMLVVMLMPGLIFGMVLLKMVARTLEKNTPPEPLDHRL